MLVFSPVSSSERPETLSTVALATGIQLPNAFEHVFMMEVDTEAISLLTYNIFLCFVACFFSSSQEKNL